VRPPLRVDTFRRTDSSILKDNGEDVRVVQELLRHASTKVTLDVYAQALTLAKRAAQRKVVSMIRGESQCTRNRPDVAALTPLIISIAQ
jgi:integrase